MRNSLSLLSLLLCSAAQAGEGEIRDFKMQTCKSQTCIVVTGPNAWVSQADGRFVVTSPGEGALLRIVRNGKTTREFSGSEIVSRPETDSISIDSMKSVIFVNVSSGDFEVISKLNATGMTGEESGSL